MKEITCPECGGIGHTQIPYVSPQTPMNPFCDTCDGTGKLKTLVPGEVAVKTITIALIISLLETYPDDADEADIALAKQAVAELKTLLGGPR